MIKEIYGKKIGMTQVFNEEGDLFATTLIEVEPAYVLEKVNSPSGTKARIGVFKINEKKLGKVKNPILGYFKKLGVAPYKLIREVFVQEDASFSFKEEPAKESQSPKEEPEKKQSQDNESQAFSLGGTPVVSPKASQEASGQEAKEQVQETHEAKEAPKEEVNKDEEKRNPREVGVEIFSEGELVDVRAKSKGKGFAGGMKRHNWAGQPGSHGSTTHRRPGSIGASAYPSRVIKGRDMPGHLGNAFVTIKNLRVLKVDKEKNILFLNGSIPGSRGSVVRIKKIG